MARSVYEHAGHYPAAFEFARFPPAVALIRQTLTAEIAAKTIKSICRLSPETALKEFFTLYGDLVGFTPHATTAPNGKVVRALICAGSRDAPALFAELSREHSCHVSAKLDKKWIRNAPRPPMPPPKIAAADIAATFEAFYGSVTCLSTAEVATAAAAEILAQDFSHADTLGALARIARICPVTDWSARTILTTVFIGHKTTAQKCATVMLFLEHFSPSLRDTPPVEYKNYDDCRNDTLLFAALWHRKREIFGVWARLLKPSPLLASFLLMSALLSEDFESAALCFALGGTLPEESDPHALWALYQAAGWGPKWGSFHARYSRYDTREEVLEKITNRARRAKKLPVPSLNMDAATPSAVKPAARSDTSPCALM